MNKKHFTRLAELKTRMITISRKKNVSTFCIKTSLWDVEDNTMKNILEGNDKCAPISYISTPRVSQFASVTGLVRDSSQSHPL